MTELARDADWQRLDPRMLVVNPVQDLIKYLPALIGVVLAGSLAGGRWQVLAVVIPLISGVVRYLTTRFRVADGRVELRRGLISRHHLSASLDRVRTVDLTATVIHRMLGLSTVRIGTGTGSTSEDEELDLDGLPVERARALRRELLEVAARAHGREPGDVEETAEPTERVAARFEARWLRYAPFTSSGLAILGAGFAAVSQIGDGFRVDRAAVLRVLGLGWLGEHWWTLALLGLLVALMLMVVLSVTAYAAAYGRLVLAFTEPSGPWQLRRGLLTTRETSIDTDRLAGVTLGEPLLLRCVGGARLSAIVTGLKREETGGSLLVPPAPQQVVAGAAAAVVGTDEPVIAQLRRHPPAATVRRYTRALLPALVLAGLLAVPAAATERWWLLVGVPLLLAAAVGLAADRARALGHELLRGFLVARSGSLLRRRDVLATRHVIGWTFRDTWFQRRRGLTTLLATTAGGRQYVEVLDVAEAAAVELSRAAMPGLVEPFLAEG